MKILIAADMEGISGVTTWDQVTAGKPDYPRFCRIMTEDVNAAVRGAFDAKVEEVFVTDGHANGSNILIEDLDPRASLNTGSPSPLSMMQGVDEVDGVRPSDGSTVAFTAAPRERRLARAVDPTPRLSCPAGSAPE